ncbi:MAG: hypothetical protein GY874_20640 [Desulfobacteraceae bacterium]|nr:hypothetical protein [Desulfobacteraceae bacterium]
MIHKIISSAQGGVELAALDVALKLDIGCGGWTYSDIYQKDKNLVEKYNLKFAPAIGFDQAVEKNVTQSDGTLVIFRSRRCDKLEHVAKAVLENQKQFLNADFAQYSHFDIASLISSWISMQRIRTVYITGSGEDQDRNIYLSSKKILETAIYLGYVKTGIDPLHYHKAHDISSSKIAKYPCNVKEAVEKLKKVIPLKERTILANLQPDDLNHLGGGLSEYIKQAFGLYAGNADLLKSCAETGSLDRPLADEASAVILRAFYDYLKKTHKLRVVK